MEAALDITVTHPKGGDVWVGMWSLHLKQLLKIRFESSNCTYNNAFSNLTEKKLTFYRKALKELPKTLAEAVSELRKEHAEVKKLGEQMHAL